MQTDKRAMGQMLVDGNLINAQDLEFALDHLQHSREPLGRVLVRMGAVTEGELDDFMNRSL